jgi:DNA-binding Lrp family transcriptional regulator
MSLAYVMMNTVPDKMETVLEEIKKLEGVKEAYMLYGVYDIIATINAGNIEELKAIILKIRKNEYVSSTLTLLVVS